MENDSNTHIFDLEKLESSEVESEQDLRPAKTVRRTKRVNTAQLDLFSQTSIATAQEPHHARTDELSTDRAGIDESAIQQPNRTQRPEVLARVRTEEGGSFAVTGDSEENPDADGGSTFGYADGLAGNGEATPVSGTDGGVEPSDEDRGGELDGKNWTVFGG